MPEPAIFTSKPIFRDSLLRFPYSRNVLFLHEWFYIRLVAGLSHGRHIFSETFPVPLGRSERIPIVALSINPVSDSMPGRILSGHDGSSGRGTHALCVKSRKTNTLFSQSLHIRGMYQSFSG